MKILLIPIALAAMLSSALAQSDANKLFGAKQEAGKQIDYTIGTFVNDYLTIRISPALIGARVSSDDIQRPSYQISLTDETGTRQTVVHRQGEKLFGEIQEEGTTFRFWVEASKDTLIVICDGEKFTFKRVNKFPPNPFAPKVSPGKPKRS